MYTDQISPIYDFLTGIYYDEYSGTAFDEPPSSSSDNTPATNESDTKQAPVTTVTETPAKSSFYSYPREQMFVYPMNNTKKQCSARRSTDLLYIGIIICLLFILIFSSFTIASLLNQISALTSGILHNAISSHS